MAIFTDNDILTILRDQNPWWVSGQVNPAVEKPFHRGEYYEASRAFFHEIRRFPVLSGLRRVGKSCILYQMIGDLLRSGVPPIKIIYISLSFFSVNCCNSLYINSFKLCSKKNC